MYQLRAEDPATGEVVGWRKSARILPERGKATIYVAPSQLASGIQSAETRWPQYQWRAFRFRSTEEVRCERGPKGSYSREDVWGLVLKERMACAHAVGAPGSVAYAQMLLGRPKTLEELECEVIPSTR